MSNADSIIRAAREVRVVFGASGVLTDPEGIGNALSCTEAEVLADLFRAVGLDDLATALIVQHVDKDDDDDDPDHVEQRDRQEAAYRARHAAATGTAPYVITDADGGILDRFTSEEERNDALHTGEYPDDSQPAYVNEPSIFEDAAPQARADAEHALALLAASSSDVPADGSVRVLVVDSYGDRQAERKVDVPEPADPDDLDDWWGDVVFPHTGDGGGGDAYTEATVTEAPGLPQLVGRTYSWQG